MADALTVQSRAKLDADGAMAHLYHFCALLPHQPYVDNRPIFEIIEHPVDKSFTAAVTLPNCINASARCTKGHQEWKTRKAAMKDAAFQGYKRLFQEGLLNDHLLPLADEKVLSTATANELPAVVEVSGQLDPGLKWPNHGYPLISTKSRSLYSMMELMVEVISLFSPDSVSIADYRAFHDVLG